MSGELIWGGRDTSTDPQGGNGYINGKPCSGQAQLGSELIADYPAGRLLRDSRLYTVGAGTQEIRRMLIGRQFNEMYDEQRGKAVMQ